MIRKFSVNFRYNVQMQFFFIGGPEAIIVSLKMTALRPMHVSILEVCPPSVIIGKVGMLQMFGMIPENVLY